ncbi:type II secretion system F family protein [Actinokineospora auranticolor]|uniref:Type II secretion system (T2SS) protein F n=1 Tax=Actinokineospora auranticolor TaxID=155976 RepID=A0A2S6GDR6_9PSEU|nr:type II secretion system F family protein [Actinokineospora auranticolor]PPK63365.1 type II secretion system (T2SS) protein F [Actinokineospora auranticolor]
MITFIVLGAGAGAGLWALVVFLFPPRPALGVVLAAATTPPVPAPILATDDTGWAVRLGRPAIPALRALGLPGRKVGRDLAVAGRSVSVHLAEKAVLAVAGLLLPALASAVLALAGFGLGLQFPLVAGLVLGVVGFLAPDLNARNQAAALRAGFRHALSAYLDLVWITLAGGMGVDSALGDSVLVGRGWAFEQLGRALDAARLTRATPWAALRQLGEELDVSELAELAASVSLAGTEGAKVRTSLAAKAQALRTHQITEAEGAAQAATERLSLPVMVLFLGFLAFITYPALTQVLNGL